MLNVQEEKWNLHYFNAIQSPQSSGTLLRQRPHTSFNLSKQNVDWRFDQDVVYLTVRWPLLNYLSRGNEGSSL